MEYTELNPSKIHVMNNNALVEFIDDDIQKNESIVIVKQNYSSKIRSNYVGRIIDRPDFMYINKDQTAKASLEDLIKGESIISYDPRSIQLKFKWEDKIYHLIRVEDIYCKLEGYEEKSKEDK